MTGDYLLLTVWAPKWDLNLQSMFNSIYWPFPISSSPMVSKTPSIHLDAWSPLSHQSCMWELLWAPDVNLCSYLENCAIYPIAIGTKHLKHHNSDKIYTYFCWPTSQLDAPRGHFTLEQLRALDVWYTNSVIVRTGNHMHAWLWNQYL